MGARQEVVRLAAVGDIHCSRTSQGDLQPLFAWAAEQADVLLLCGDLTDYGLPEEAKILVEELAAAEGMPKVAVLGNHDHECAKHDELQRILVDAGIIVLDGEACEIESIGFAGVKGFAGGFGERMLQSWGEEAIKHFVNEGVAEAVKLEAALTRLKTEHRIVLMHYAPIRDTIEGEELEIYPFLGSSRLELALNPHAVTAVFHGHAHKGRHAGHTSTGIPVYNVAVPVLRAVAPDRPPLFLYDVPRARREVA
jgi:Icc-related predicted phosphoesterase